MLFRSPLNKILIKEYDKIYIKEKEATNNEEYKIIFEKELKVNNFIFKQEKDENLDGNNICRIKSNNIKFPLYFRNRKDGDYITLKTSNVRKKVKEIFIENKIPLSKRKNYPLLVDSNDTIIWIPNLKKSNLCYKKDENYDIIIKCIEGDENYE